jgi:RND family efflux transporter MFP subunit
MAMAAAFAGGLWVAGGPPSPARLDGGAVPAAQPEPLAAVPRASGRLVASGYVVARRKATVAAEITGKIAEVFIEEGMVVAAGQVLARLDAVLAERDLALARSRVASAEAAAGVAAADLRNAERVLERTRALARGSVASQADLIKAESQAESLRAQLRKAQADIETARLDVGRNEEVLDKYRIRAPFAGVVVDKSAQPGEMISPLSAGGGFTRTGICTIVDMDSIEVEVDVNEAFIHGVTARQPVDAVLDAYPDWIIPASVIAIVPTANREKATVKVRIALDRKDPRILADMAVKVTFMDSPRPPPSPAR